MKTNKKSQEEMVGFALIIIIVAVIILIFLSLYLRKSPQESVESYEVESFIQSFLQHTTTCQDYLEYLPIQKLMFKCLEGEDCLNGNSCNILNETLQNITDKSWNTQEGSSIRGYALEISAGEQKILFLDKGNKTGNSKGGIQEFSKSGESVKISFLVYY